MPGWLNTAPYRTKWRDKGFLFIADDGMVDSPFPDCYHTTFHAPWCALNLEACSRSEHNGKILESY